MVYSRVVPKCSRISFSIKDEFTNPDDTNGAHARSDVIKKQACYDKCINDYKNDIKNLGGGRLAKVDFDYQNCRNKCDDDHIDRAIEIYPTDLGTVRGNPFLLRGTWEDKMSRGYGSSKCPSL